MAAIQGWDMAYCFICGDLCDNSSMKNVPGIRIEMTTKKGWLPSRIPKRLAGPNPRNWWQDTVNKSISSTWSLCGPCAAEFDSSSSGKGSSAPESRSAPTPAPSSASTSTPPPGPSKDPAPSAKPSKESTAQIAAPVDTSVRPDLGKPPETPALKAIKRWQLISLSPGSFGIMIAIILFATAEKEIPFSTLLVPISLVSIAILAVLVLEGKKVQLARGAWEEQAWGGFFQNTFQAWRGGLLDELAPWYRSTPSNYRGFQDFIANNIEIRAFRKLGGWFQALDGEFLVEVPSGNKAKPSYLLTSQRGFVKDFDEGWVSFPWNQVKRIATSREANRVEITLGNAGGDHILTSLSAPSDRSLDFLVKKQGIGMSQVREEPEPDVPRSISAVVASASTASSEDLRWLSSQGPEAVAAIVALSDRMRAGDWDLAEGVAKLCIPLGDLGGEDARRLLSTLLQIPDPTREAEIVREGAARGLERLRSRA